MTGFKNISQRFKLLFRRIGLIILVYSLMRLLFLLFNYNFFTSAGFMGITTAFLAGLRFDLSAIAYTNMLVILLHLLPVKQFFTNTYQKILKWCFIFFNIPPLIFNMIDVAFFRFQGKRSTADLLSIIFLNDDISRNLTGMMIDFWYIPVLVVISVIFLIRYYPEADATYFHSRKKISPLQWIWFVTGIIITIITMRGGFQLKPLRIISAVNYAEPVLTPLVLNTTFTIIRTTGKEKIQIPDLIDPAEAVAYFNPLKEGYKEKMNDHNVVIIILESFSAEYTKDFTPVFNSIATKGLYFPNGIANSKRSIDALPAITSSLPALMGESYITSTYSGNNLSGLAGYLGDAGYQTSFFHGGNNGTMGFDNFTRMTGFVDYYGRNECDECRFDGKWGVYDEDFFSFFADELDNMKQPFISCFFSLSSHHPYQIPPEFADKFPEGTIDIHESIGYADHSLGTFFERVSGSEWFSNTLFVITADHTGPPSGKEYMNSVDNFRIPVIYYMPSKIEPLVSDHITSQCDVVPSILDLLNYNSPFIAFGESVFSRDHHSFAVNFTGNMYQCFNDSIVIQFDGNKVISVHDHRTDPFFKEDLNRDRSAQFAGLELLTKSYLQQYLSRIESNKLVPK